MGVADTDKDGLTDEFERRTGTDPFDKDSDNDGLMDGAELRFGTSCVIAIPTATGTTTATRSAPTTTRCTPIRRLNTPTSSRTAGATRGRCRRPTIRTPTGWSLTTSS